MAKDQGAGAVRSMSVTGSKKLLALGLTEIQAVQVILGAFGMGLMAPHANWLPAKSHNQSL